MIFASLTALVLLLSPSAAPCDKSALVVDQHAAAVRYTGCWKVEYSVSEAFPALELVGRLDRKLAAEGWVALDSDPTNPANSSGKVHTWLEYRLGDKDDTRVDSWIGWFIRGDKCRLQLSLRYFGRPTGDVAARPVSVGVIFVTPQEWEKRPK